MAAALCRYTKNRMMLGGYHLVWHECYATDTAFSLRMGDMRSLVRVPPACSYCVESGLKVERMPLRAHVTN
jgi:hypothetical protein